VIKGCNIFWGQKLENTCSFVGGHIIMQQKKKILRAVRRWTNPLNVLQEAIHHTFVKFFIYCFFLWYEFSVYYALRVKKNYQLGLDGGPLEFQFLRWRGCLTNSFRTLLLSFGVIRKTPRLISRDDFVKKMFVCISHRDNVLARCDLIFPLLRCQGEWNKTCTQLSLSQILLQNPKNCSLGDIQRFCHHFLGNSMVIFDQISNSSNVYLSLSQFWTATSLIIFYQLPSILKSRIPPKRFDRFRASFP
jgi:hypothetical protein